MKRKEKCRVIYLTLASPSATPPVKPTRKMCKLLIFGPDSSPMSEAYQF